MTRKSNRTRRSRRRNSNSPKLRKKRRSKCNSRYGATASQPTNQQINQPQPINQPINQPTNQPVVLWVADLRIEALGTEGTWFTVTWFPYKGDASPRRGLSGNVVLASLQQLATLQDQERGVSSLNNQVPMPQVTWSVINAEGRSEIPQHIQRGPASQSASVTNENINQVFAWFYYGGVNPFPPDVQEPDPEDDGGPVVHYST